MGEGITKVLGFLFSWLSNKEKNKVEDPDDVLDDIKEVRQLRREMNRLVRKKLLTREEAQATVKVMIANIRRKKDNANRK